MGDQQNPPNADPSTGLSTQAAAAGQSTGALGGITNALSNPLLQGLLGMYAGAVGTPRSEGLGGAIKGGVTGGLSLFDKARQEQMAIPLQQAQLQEAQLKAQQLKQQLIPLGKDQIQGLVDWQTTLQARAKAHPDPSDALSVDPSDVAIVNSLVSQARGGQLTAGDLDKAMLAMKESNMINALSKRYGTVVAGEVSSAAISGNAAAPPGQTAPPATTQAAPSGGSPFPTSPGTAQMNVPGKGMIIFQTDMAGKHSYSADGGKSWVQVP